MEEQFLHILRNKITGKERAAFFRQLEEDQEMKRAYTAFEKLWVVNNMAHKHTPARHRKEVFRSFWRYTHPAKQVRMWQTVSGVAAAVILALLMAGVWWFGLKPEATRQMVFSAPKGNISEVTLADGSHIWLNSASQATITMQGSKKIEVDLAGEAFFDVPHDASREFLVNTGRYTHRDLGTRFNVKYDAANRRLSTALFDGAIEFRRAEKVILDDLEPGTMFTLDLNTRELKLSPADAEFITAWKEGKFVFVNKPLKEIAHELEEWYDVKFVFENEKMKEELFSGVIKRRTSMEHLLKVLQLSAKMDYSIEELEDGSSIVYFDKTQ